MATTNRRGSGITAQRQAELDNIRKAAAKQLAYQPARSAKNSSKPGLSVKFQSKIRGSGMGV